jgi:hypothetical protein
VSPTADQVTAFANAVHVVDLDRDNFRLPDGAAMTSNWWDAVESWPEDHRPRSLDARRRKGAEEARYSTGSEVRIAGYGAM